MNDFRRKPKKSPEVIAKMKEMYAAGEKYVVISAELNVHAKTINRHCKGKIERKVERNVRGRGNNTNKFLLQISEQLEAKAQDPKYLERLPLEFERERLRKITLSLAEALREEYKVR